MITIEQRLPADHFERVLAADVRTGLGALPKTLPPKWFYDSEGSRLFERITELPEYYPTRAEAEILSAHAAEFAALTRAGALIELGSGSGAKTRLLLDALSQSGSLREFVPLDVSESALRESCAKLAIDYPRLNIHGVVGDFGEPLDALPGNGPRVLAMLGGTIGNQEPRSRAVFLAGLRAVLEPGEWLLLGTDLVKEPAVLRRAYDDSAGVTGEFNRNVLRVLNRELAADFEVPAFEHRAVWDAEQEWVEMRLRASKPMRVRIAKLDMIVSFAEHEELRTEISAKFRRVGIERELAAAGFATVRCWTDARQRFALTLARCG